MSMLLTISDEIEYLLEKHDEEIGNPLRTYEPLE
jgi:hypothetical protein